VTRELGLGLQTDQPLAAYGAHARAVEEAGFAVVTLFNDLWFRPPLAALLEVARATDRVRVGASCHNPYTVHPVELAGQVALLDEASSGRAFLGLTPGAWLDELEIDHARPLEAIREAWEVVRRLLAGDRSGFQGNRFHLPPGRGLRTPPPRPRVPLLVGTWSPRLTAFAAAEADELKLGGSANPGMVELTRSRMQGVERRAPGALTIVAGAVTVVDHDREAARALARRHAALFLPVVAPRDDADPVDLELLGRIQALAAVEEFEQAGALISDDLLDRFAYAGTPKDVAARASEVLDAGAGRVDFGPPQGLTAERGVTLLAAEVAHLIVR
jgi:5,10-methylenetetrahydromethanopterin reductase